MINYIEYLGLPKTIAIVLVAIFLIIQIIGEILEFKGKVVVPEIMKVRKYFARKKTERKAKKEMPDTINELKSFLFEVKGHYDKDNISMRDKWMENVNLNLKKIEELDEKIDKNNKVTLDIMIENMRDSIINFASKVANEDFPVTKEQFNRIFKKYDDYEKLIEENGLINGEVDIAYRIIQESYKKHLKNRTFIEDIRGY